MLVLHVVVLRAKTENLLVSLFAERHSARSSRQSVESPTSHISPVYGPLYNTTKFILKAVK